MKKLELKHLRPYLLNNTMCSYKEYSDETNRLSAYLTGISSEDGVETTYKRKANGCSGDLIGFNGHNNLSDLEFKLHLRPLSDLTKEIEVNGEEFIPVERIREILVDIDGEDGMFDYAGNVNFAQSFMYYGCKIAIMALPHNIVEKLFEWHFDVFVLIEKGLAIDINTL